MPERFGQDKPAPHLAEPVLSRKDEDLWRTARKRAAISTRERANAVQRVFEAVRSRIDYDREVVWGVGLVASVVFFSRSVFATLAA
jgi:hypothetical protein